MEDEKGTIYINDLESDYNYYMGLNYTQTNDGKVPNGNNYGYYSDSNLAKLYIQYNGSDVAGNNIGYVSNTEQISKFNYYKRYPVVDGYVTIELIDHPFGDRPNNKAFNGCNISEIIIPENSQLTSIGQETFSGCKIREIIIPESVTSIGDNAFYGCTSLDNVIIPSSVNTIESMAFAGCISLNKIYIPSTVSVIANDTFLYDNNLTIYGVAGSSAHAYAQKKNVFGLTVKVQESCILKAARAFLVFKALEELGFELPKPNEKKGKYNNRKMGFDDECRKLFISICQKHGLNIDVEPVYGGASYLEKQDFILMNQQKRIEEKQALLDGLMMKIEDVNAVVEEAVDLAYEKACEVVTERVKEETVKHDVDVVKDYGELLQKQPKEKLSDSSKSVASKVVNAIVFRLEKASQVLLGNIISALNEPKNKTKAKEQIKEHARVSIQEKLKAMQKQIREDEQKRDVPIRKKNMEL